MVDQFDEFERLLQKLRLLPDGVAFALKRDLITAKRSVGRELSLPQTVDHLRQAGNKSL